MSSDDSILVLTTREKEWWLSMQEIIPGIERVWAGIGESTREDVRILFVPLASETDHIFQTSAPRFKRIVITSTTPETVRVALHLRQQMKVPSPFIVYVSGDSTEGFHAFGALVNVLTERDIIVVACEAEEIGTRHCFPNAQVRIIPFALVDQFRLSGKERDTRLETARLAYVGRVSEQKNLHTLLLALWILRAYHSHLPNITLDVFGGVDNLGSPNMGLKFPDYDHYLRGLAEALGIDHLVTWHGLQDRDWLFDNVHLKPHILVSPTLHSDENFGSSVLASLVNGHQVVTTAWGGHFGFKEWFPDQLTLVPVHRSNMGPVVDPFLLANAILGSVNRISSVVVDDARLDRARMEFSESNIIKRSSELLHEPLGRSVPLEKSATLHHINKRRTVFGGGRRIYESYEDPAAEFFFKAYGMQEPLKFQVKSSYILPPWVSFAEGVLSVVDPHRGRLDFNFDPRETKTLDVTMCPSMTTVRLPDSLLNNLVARGYAFSLPLADETK